MTDGEFAGFQCVHPAQEEAEQVEQELEVSEALEPPPRLKALISRSGFGQPHSGQGGFFADELRSSSSNRA